MSGLRCAIAARANTPGHHIAIAMVHLLRRPISPHRRQAQADSEGLRRFNQQVFNNQLPADLPIVWKKRLTTTAGRMNYSLDQTCAPALVALEPGCR